MPTILTLPEQPPKFWPRFTSPLRSVAVTARVGRVLGIAFGICFVTGLLSHYQYQPWSWLPEPSAPKWGYRLTQGTHVITGIATIPLLLVKLWSVFPKLFTWPPLPRTKALISALERLSIAVLVSSALVELFTGLLNIMDWYAWPWDFVPVHRFLGYVVIGSILLHIAVKLPRISEGLHTPLNGSPQPPVEARTTPRPAPKPAPRPAPTRPAAPESAAPESAAPESAAHGPSRRGVLTATGAGVGLVVATTVGQVITPLSPIGLFAVRDSSKGPAGVPVNRTADQAAVTTLALDPFWKLLVVGPTSSYELDLDDLDGLSVHEASFPISCVEGWSVGADWRGLRLLDVITKAGGDSGSRVRVTSLEPGGSYRLSYVDGPQVSAALLATHLNGARLDVNHGYPLRLIAPNRAGVLNTKWLTMVEVL